MHASSLLPLIWLLIRCRAEETRPIGRYNYPSLNRSEAVLPSSATDFLLESGVTYGPFTSNQTFTLKTNRVYDEIHCVVDTPFGEYADLILQEGGEWPRTARTGRGYAPGTVTIRVRTANQTLIVPVSVVRGSVYVMCAQYEYPYLHLAHNESLSCSDWPRLKDVEPWWRDKEQWFAYHLAPSSAAARLLTCQLEGPIEGRNRGKVEIRLSRDGPYGLERYRGALDCQAEGTLSPVTCRLPLVDHCNVVWVHATGSCNNQSLRCWEDPNLLLLENGTVRDVSSAVLSQPNVTIGQRQTRQLYFAYHATRYANTIECTITRPSVLDIEWKIREGDQLIDGLNDRVYCEKMIGTAPDVDACRFFVRRNHGQLLLGYLAYYKDLDDPALNLTIVCWEFEPEPQLLTLGESSVARNVTVQTVARYQIDLTSLDKSTGDHFRCWASWSRDRAYMYFYVDPGPYLESYIWRGKMTSTAWAWDDLSNDWFFDLGLTTDNASLIQLDFRPREQPLLNATLLCDLYNPLPTIAPTMRPSESPRATQDLALGATTPYFSLNRDQRQVFVIHLPPSHIIANVSCTLSAFSGLVDLSMYTNEETPDLDEGTYCYTSCYAFPDPCTCSVGMNKTTSSVFIEVQNIYDLTNGIELSCIDVNYASEPPGSSDLNDATHTPSINSTDLNDVTIVPSASPSFAEPTMSPSGGPEAVVVIEADPTETPVLTGESSSFAPPLCDTRKLLASLFLCTI